MKERIKSIYRRCLESLKGTLSHLGLVIPNHLFQTHPDAPARLPLQNFLGPGGIRSPLLGIINGHGLADNIDALGQLHTILLLDLLNDFTNKLSKFANLEFFAVTQINRTSLVRVHEGDETINQVVNVLEGAGLVTITIEGHVFTTQSLSNEVGYNATIERVHCKLY